MLNPESVAIALITLYPKWYRGKLRSISHTDKVRGDLALEFIQKATSLHHQIIVADGYSAKNFRKELKQFQDIKILKRRSKRRSSAKRQAIKVASELPGVKIIIATEPEKVSLIGSISAIAQPILRDEADIIMPKREEQLFQKTYPDYMYVSEIEGNRIYNQELRLSGLLPKNSEDLDWFFGPKAFRNNPKVLSLFTKTVRFQFEKNTFSEEYFDSNVSYFPVIMALKKNIRIKSLQISFSYPQTQKNNEGFGARDFFIKKREAQRLGILLELMYLLNYLKKR